MLSHQSEQINEFADALANFQSVVGPIPKNHEVEVFPKNGKSYKYTFADLSDIREAIRVPLAANGLSFVQMPEPGEGREILFRTTVLHKSGQFMSATLPLIFEGGMQSMGSAITYARRYMLTSMLGIVTESDDDGQAAGTGRGRQDRGHQSPPSNGRREIEQLDRLVQAKYDPTTPPSNGRELFQWCAAVQNREGIDVLKWINAIAKRNGLPGRMVDWSAEQAIKMHGRAARKLDAQLGVPVGGGSVNDPADEDDRPY